MNIEEATRSAILAAGPYEIVSASAEAIQFFNSARTIRNDAKFLFVPERVKSEYFTEALRRGREEDVLTGFVFTEASAFTGMREPRDSIRTTWEAYKDDGRVSRIRKLRRAAQETLGSQIDSEFEKHPLLAVYVRDSYVSLGDLVLYELVESDYSHVQDNRHCATEGRKVKLKTRYAPMKDQPKQFGIRGNTRNYRVFFCLPTAVPAER